MKQAARVLIIYLFGLLVCSFLFSIAGLTEFVLSKQVTIRAMMPVTVIGGILALRKTVSGRALKIFLVVYFCLWVLRFIIIYFASKVGEVNFLGMSFRVDLISMGYYRSISRLETPLPFVIFWFINYFFSAATGKESESEKERETQKK
jgi:hypothetical protein